MVDPERLRRILRKVADDVETLRGYATADRTGLLADDARLGHVKYLFVTAIEGCIDAAQHTCASERWGPPNDNADAMRVLAERDVIPLDLAERLVTAVGFRNILVHQYRDVDDERVTRHLDDLEDLDRFVDLVGRLA